MQIEIKTNTNYIELKILIYSLLCKLFMLTILIDTLQYTHFVVFNRLTSWWKDVSRNLLWIADFPILWLLLPVIATTCDSQLWQRFIRRRLFEYLRMFNAFTRHFFFRIRNLITWITFLFHVRIRLIQWFGTVIDSKFYCQYFLNYQTWECIFQTECTEQTQNNNETNTEQTLDNK